MSDITNAMSEPYNVFLDLDDDVKDWLQIDAEDDTYDRRLGRIHQMACRWVQNFLGRPIAPMTYHRRFDGGVALGSQFIMLPKTPVLEVVNVTETRGSFNEYTLTESTPGAQTDGWQLTPETGRLTRVFPGNVGKPWFPGMRNIDVTWVAGFNPIPPDIEMATLELIAHWFRNTQQQPGLTVPGIPAGSEYEPADNATPGLWQGLPYRVKDLLGPYVKMGMG